MRVEPESILAYGCALRYVDERKATAEHVLRGCSADGRPLLLIRIEAEERTERRGRTARADRCQAVGAAVRARCIVGVRQAQRRMIERRPLIADAVVGEREQERDERLFLRIAEAERTDL